MRWSAASRLTDRGQQTRLDAPGRGFYILATFWGRSSVGRTLDWQSRGQGFDSPRLHQPLPNFMAVAETVRKLTEAEYLALERAAESKSEFFDGEMFAMAGGSPMHALIAANLIRELGMKLKGRPCKPFTSDLRLKVEATGLLTYPDVSVLCGPLQFAADTDDTVVNPTLLIEVLSDSTEAYDRGEKFQHYRQMRKGTPESTPRQTDTEQFIRCRPTPRKELY